MSRTVHLGDRSPVVVTDWSSPNRENSTRTFEAREDGTVEVTQKDADLLMATVPTARYADPKPPQDKAPDADDGDSTDSTDSPSTPSGRGRGRRNS